MNKINLLYTQINAYKITVNNCFLLPLSLFIVDIIPWYGSQTVIPSANRFRYHWATLNLLAIQQPYQGTQSPPFELILLSSHLLSFGLGRNKGTGTLINLFTKLLWSQVLSIFCHCLLNHILSIENSSGWQTRHNRGSLCW